jgi:hypothetical protein
VAVVVGAVGVGDVELAALLEIALRTSLQCNLFSYLFVWSSLLLRQWRWCQLFLLWIELMLDATM